MFNSFETEVDKKNSMRLSKWQILHLVHDRNKTSNIFL